MAASRAQADRIDVPTEKVARYTVRPCPRTSAVRPACVVLVPPCTDLAVGFEMAKTMIATGEPVRLVAIGVTLPRAWPSWVTDTPGLWLTDLTAYRSKTRWEATQPLRESLRAFADELFAETFADLRGSDVFYPHIGTRAFSSVAFVMPIAVGLAEHHAMDEVRCTRPDWPGFALYRALACLEQSRVRQVEWIGRVAALSVVGWAAALMHTLSAYVQSRIGLNELRRLPTRRTVGLWLHLAPDWPRINAALIEATRNRDVGVLLHGHIGPGERDESHLAKRRGRELWPGLRGLDRGRVDAWDTTSTPAGFTEFARCCARFTRNCAVATARLCRHGPLLKMGSSHIDLSAHAYDLAKLLTIDMARVCMADAATSNAIRNQQVRGSTVLFVGALQSDFALVARRLHRAGATIIDFAHGWSGEPMPFVAEPASSYRCVWAQTDSGDGDVRFVVGGMPIPPRLPRPDGPSRVRVLVMSNYVHRDDVVEQIGLDPYQDELLDVIRRRADRYAFRWRPHPADRPEPISRAAEGLPAELSRGRALAEDLAWSDVVVSTMSSVLLQALLLDRPVLIHVTPDLEGTLATSPFSPKRMFFFARDGVEMLDAVVAALSDPDLLTPERRARVALFGETQTPRSLAEAIASLMPAKEAQCVRVA